MRTVADTAALIIDVRGNGGGQPGTVALLAAYLLTPDSVLLGTIHNRSLGVRTENRTPAHAANPGGFVRLPGEFTAFIPTGRVTNPVTGTNWEGVGVTPDVAVAGAAALEAAQKAVAAPPI